MLYKELQIAVIVFFSLAFVSTTLNVTNCQNVAYHMPVASYGTGNGWRGTGPRGLPSPPTAIMRPAPFLPPLLTEVWDIIPGKILGLKMLEGEF